jgi:hypothetical protein
MVLVEELDALDLLIWLGSGSAVAQRLGCDQSTISRRSRQCQQVLRDNAMLQLQREVHQLYRLRQGRQLRLDASLLAAPLLGGAQPEGWIAGHLNRLGWRRPLQLLQDRILDAWITAMGQELGQLEGLDVCRIPLARTPLLLASQPDHPLLRQSRLQLSDVGHLPRLAPRQGRYPRTERLLGAKGLENGGQHRSGSLMLHYGTAFSLAHQPSLRPLPLDLGVSTELTLVVRRDLVEQPSVGALVHELRQRLVAACRSGSLADGGLVCLN